MGLLTRVVSYFATLGEGKLPILLWNPIILLPARLFKVYYTWNRTHPIKRDKKWDPGLASPVPNSPPHA